MHIIQVHKLYKQYSVNAVHKYHTYAVTINYEFDFFKGFTAKSRLTQI